MPKFCANCGSPLQEGQACTCQQQKASVQSDYAIPKEGPSELVLFLKGMLELFKSFIKKPTLIVKMAAQKQDYKAGLFYLGLQSLITAIFVILVVSRITNAVSSSFGLLGGILGGSLFDYYFDYYDVPYFSIFLKVFIYTAVQFFLLSGLIFGSNKLLTKNQSSYKALIAAMGVASIPATAMLLISIPMVFVSFSLVIYFAVFAILSTLILNFVAVKETLGVSEDRSFYILVISNIIYYFLIFKVGIGLISG